MILFYLEERQNQFPGVEIQPIWLRTYPLNDIAAQLFGTIGPISPAELKERRFHGLPQNSIIGQSGLEWYYNHYLQGTDGSDQVQVDALGRSRARSARSARRPGTTSSCRSTSTSRSAGEKALAAGDQLEPAVPTAARS